MQLIDAHLHLWKEQKGIAGGKSVYSLGGGKSSFLGETVQMMPPYIDDGFNSVERLMANMDYDGVWGCVVTQEYIDGNQDDYLLESKGKYPERMKICCLYEEDKRLNPDGFDGIKICAGRLKTEKLSDLGWIFDAAQKNNLFISIDLAEGDWQAKELERLVCEYPSVRVAIGHFGMVTREGWLEQVKLACYPNVYVESGGITWLFHKEFYPYPSAVEAILQAADICGMEKIMWGSDYPRTMTAITYRMSFDFVSKSDRLNNELKDAFLWKNAATFYGFDRVEDMSPIRNMVED